jgi:hypothetical protein
MAEAIAVSSSSPAFSVGVKSPVEVRWLSVRDVEKPSAPARTASLARAAIALLSSGVDGSRRAPRSPITYTRSAACGSCAPISMSKFRFDSHSM